MIQLRDYQAIGIDRISARYAAGHRRVVFVAPTGSGKSRTAAAIVERAVARGNRTLLLAPRLEILDQLVAEVAATGLEVRSIHAEHDEGPQDAPVTVASVWTLATPRWRDRLPVADLIVVDECHRILAGSYRRLIECYPQAWVLGLTATPARSDGRGLRDMFDALVSTTTVKELTERKFLVPCDVLVPRSFGSGKGLALDVAQAYRQHCDGRLAIVFAASVPHAETVTAELVAAGIPAGLVTGGTPDHRRRDTLQSFAAGTLKVLVNVSCFVEGLDVPACSAAILARTFSHVGSYLQAIGRVLRPFPGKSRAIAVDLIGSALDHGPPERDRAFSLDGRGIRTAAKRDAIRQCETCGSVQLAGAPRCAFCGAVYPVAARQTPRSTGAGVALLGSADAPRRRPEYVATIVSKRGGRCFRCGRGIRKGETIRWATVARVASHLRCLVEAGAATGAP